MIKNTIAKRVIEERAQAGQQLLGRAKGLYSFRKGSNLANELKRLGLDESQVDVRKGARAGRSYNEGWQLLIFSKAE